MKNKIIEILAENEHATWSSWMVWLFSISEKNLDGTITISKNDVDRWNRQAETPYHLLSEKEKESDRKQVYEVTDEFMELLQTEGWVKMRSKSQARRVRLQLEEKPGPFRYPIIEVGDNSLVTEEEE